MDCPTLGEWIGAEPVRFSMSSGFFGYFAHAGAAEALAENGHYPVEVCGSSSGGIVAGLIASGLEPEEITRHFMRVDREAFWDPGFGLGLLRGNLLDNLFRDMMPTTDFSEAKVRAAISVFDIKSRETEVIRSGDLVLAMRASSAFPGLFHPVRIEGCLKLDGGIKDHPGLTGADPGIRTIHHNLASSPLDPEHSNVQSVTAGDLPHVSPFNLRNGIEAFKMAKENMNRALHMPITGQAH